MTLPCQDCHLRQLLLLVFVVHEIQCILISVVIMGFSLSILYMAYGSLSWFMFIPCSACCVDVRGSGCLFVLVSGINQGENCENLL